LGSGYWNPREVLPQVRSRAGSAGLRR